MSKSVPLREHLAALAEAERRFMDERDRRYAEVNVEREKALKIKERADEVALGLAREIQTYKDEKANELREQINSERGIYATKAEVKPLADAITASSGRTDGITSSAKVILAAIASAAAALSAVVIALHHP